MPRPVEHLIRRSSVSVASWLFLIALVLAGCDGPAPTGPPGDGPAAGPTPCVPGELTRNDGTCQPAGLPPDMPCPPGEMLLDDGKTCQKAGVPPSACGVGFLPDGKEGCEPILPADPCPEGLMAIPGDTVCHEVAPCGSGTWGDIPVEANTEFVDQGYAGGNSDGTQAKPWTTIQKGVNAATKGAIVAVAAGSYAEDVLIQDKPVRLWGRCPAMVEVAGTGAKLGAIQVLYKAANGAEIHGVAVIGPKLGMGVSGASDVVIEGVWIHDAGYIAIDIENSLGPTSTILKGSLLEQNHGLGVLVVDAVATIEATVVRSTLPDALAEMGYGIYIENHPASSARANVTVRACLVEQNHELGVFVAGSDATIEATVVRSTLPNALGNGGRGINIQESLDTMERSSATVRGCLVEQNHDIGIFVGPSDVAIDASVVRDTAPQKSDNKFGDGIAVFEGKVTMQNVEVTRNARAGVSSFGGQVLLTGGVLTCNGFDVEGEPYYGTSFTFDGSTGWQCSDKPPAECTVLGDCHVETTGIEAPSELPPADPLKP